MIFLKQLSALSLLQQSAFVLQLVVAGGSLFCWRRKIWQSLPGESLFPGDRSRTLYLPSMIGFTGFVLGIFILPSLWISLWGASEKDPGRLMLLHTGFRLFTVVVWGGILWWVDQGQADENEPREPAPGFITATRMGIEGFLLAFLPVSVLFLCVMKFRKPHLLIELLGNQPGAGVWLGVLVAAVIAAPLFEELMFRVTFQTVLVQVCGPLKGILLGSLVFCLSHNGVDAIPLFPLAMILGGLYYRTGSYWAIVVTHALFNGYNLLLFWLSGPSAGN